MSTEKTADMDSEYLDDLVRPREHDFTPDPVPSSQGRNPLPSAILGNETGPVTELLNSLKVIDRSQRYTECRSELLTQYMYELVKLRAERNPADAS